MADYEWLLEKSGPDSNDTPASRRNSFGGGGQDRLKTLAREAIQNAVDASEGSITQAHANIVFRKKTLSGASLDKFKKLLDMKPEYLNEMEENFVLPDGESKFAFYRELRSAKELNLLIVEDYGSTGLTGPEYNEIKTSTGEWGYNNNFKPDSKFLKLIRGQGVQATLDSGSAGSFGFGKEAYMTFSKAQTLFYYTKFKENLELNDTNATERLIGRLHSNTKGEETIYSGLAFWGQKRYAKGAGNREYIAPIEGDKADEYAEALGFERRKAHEYGTSIMIVDIGERFSNDDQDSNDFERLRSSIENYWWPRLNDNLLDVRIYAQEDAKAIHPSKTRPHLENFVKLYNYVRRISIPNSPDEMVRQIGPLKAKPKITSYYKQAEFKENPEREREIAKWATTTVAGDLALLRFEVEQGEYNDDDSLEHKLETSSQIALMRSPGMVVEYLEIPDGDKVPNFRFAGVFKASNDANPAFQNAEPPAHNEWQPDLEKLQDAFQDGWLKAYFGSQRFPQKLNKNGYLVNEILKWVANFRPKPEYGSISNLSRNINDLAKGFLSPVRSTRSKDGNPKDKHSIRKYKKWKYAQGQSMKICYTKAEISLKPNEEDLLVGYFTLSSYLKVDENSKDPDKKTENLIETILIDGEKYLLDQLPKKEFVLYPSNNGLNKLTAEITSKPIEVEYSLDIIPGFAPRKIKESKDRNND